MAREYGKVLTRIWGDSDFRALSVGAQHLYLQLVSQPDMSMAGVLTTATPRWARQISDRSAEQVQVSLDELEGARFTVSDVDTMETLVRSFVRNDLGWRSPKTMIGIESSIRSVLSPRLKAVIAAELARCDMDSLSSVVSDRTGKSTREVVESLVRGLCDDFPDTPSVSDLALRDTPSDTLSEGVSDRVADGVHRVSLTATATEPEPEPAHEPAPATAPAPAAPAEGGQLFEVEKSTQKSSKKRADYSEEFETAWQAFPAYGRKAKKVAAEAYDKARERADAATILAGVERYAAFIERTDVKVKYMQGWLNADRWEDENVVQPYRNGFNRPTAEENVRSAYDVAQFYAKQEQQEVSAGPNRRLSA